MTPLTISSLDDATRNLLEESAHLHSRTVEAEAVAILRHAASRFARSRDLVLRANQIAAMASSHIEQSDSVDLLRNDRLR